MKNPIKSVIEWDKRVAAQVQESCNLTDYQMLVLSFVKGFIIGAILL